MRCAITRGTRSSYLSGYRALLDFTSTGRATCDFLQPSIHNQELFWVAFIAWLSDHRKVRHSTGRHYLYGIQSLLLEVGHHVPILRFKLVRRALKAWARREGPSISRPKLPVTVALLNSALQRAPPRNHVDRVIWAMMLLGVYALLRCGELTLDIFDSSHFPRFRDWSLVEQGSIGRFHLPSSKSDTSFQGTYVYVCANSSRTCPVTAMQAMILLAPFAWTHSAPLFSYDGIHPISRVSFLSKVRKYLAPATPAGEVISGHSFRRGGAQSLYDAGVPLSTIRDIGRWKSDIVMKRYYGFSAERLRELSDTVARAAPSRVMSFHPLKGPTKG